MLYQGIGSPKDFALRDIARRATIGLVLHEAYATLAYIPHTALPGRSTSHVRERGVCERERARCVCVCERERERERERCVCFRSIHVPGERVPLPPRHYRSVCVCVCVFESVCVCVCERERCVCERESERGVCMCVCMCERCVCVCQVDPRPRRPASAQTEREIFIDNLLVRVHLLADRPCATRFRIPFSR